MASEYIPRLLEAPLRQAFSSYPVVTLTGPRQSGKTTLVRQTFPKLPYVNLEDLETRTFATDDPKGFLRRYEQGAIFDEIQRTPDLVSYIQVLVDQRKENSLFVLTGSEQLRISQSISQSLAGRSAILRLLPLSIPELLSSQKEPLNINELLFSGFYPRIHEQKLSPTQVYRDYFETYIERDLRQLSELKNLSLFQKFVRLASGRIAQLLNLSSLGSDVGVTHTTAREWLSLLQASYIAFELPPYFTNISKRLVKSPKLFFYDVGLAAFLMGIQEPSQLETHPLRGQLFENFVVVEALKHQYNQGLRENIFFYRDKSGQEIDLLYGDGPKFFGVEIKSSETINAQFLRDLTETSQPIQKDISKLILVYGGTETREQLGVQVCNPTTLTSLLDSTSVATN